jgi:hypothetical protein
MGSSLVSGGRVTMASHTTIIKTKRANKRRKMNRKRKRRLARKSTLSYEELFAEMGPPSDSKPKK